ncbi:uncharacterized protein LOC103698773 isoform X1 [Phoenix dactylifera]|uniref:Uncharacterized protein LOC103698773 isoform X1 n=2 Tax=Phoenix dactylifera TaxID=42345 RepID=A0A8B8ZB28_PHODC|nr:uncharacterized protein LOC103698773 isoform X1 [Phoenix dactylifera]XP_038971279.1 uncharacterized protein LOC103698773 isoform X1 [Phoenix dactylifera]XP_038971280.1 uncharacterized protein LOC103698773 isoform X1 [Phoenix dactylifera]
MYCYLTCYAGLLCDVRWIVHRVYMGSILSIIIQNSCCLGGLAKSESTDRALNVHQEWNLGCSSIYRKRLWSSSPDKMENNTSNFHSPEAHLSSSPASVGEEKRFSEENGNNSSFINQASIAWNEMRREWVGDRSKHSHRRSREPVISANLNFPSSWCTTYEDLLSVGQPFPQPIPLSEMVDFLVDIWYEEGLYD